MVGKLFTPQSTHLNIKYLKKLENVDGHFLAFSFVLFEQPYRITYT